MTSGMSSADQLQQVALVVPEPWLAALRRYQDAGLTDTCIAGGALRDLDNDRPVKDVDVWVDSRAAGWMARLAAGRPFTQLDDEDLAGSNAGKIEHSLTFITPWGKVNEIAAPFAGVAEVVGSFDFGACQIGCAADGVVWATEQYFKDVAAKRFTYLPEGNDPARSRKRWERISQKYPGWTVEGLDAVA